MWSIAQFFELVPSTLTFKKTEATISPSELAPQSLSFGSETRELNHIPIFIPKKKQKFPLTLSSILSIWVSNLDPLNSNHTTDQWATRNAAMNSMGARPVFLHQQRYHWVKWISHVGKLEKIMKHQGLAKSTGSQDVLTVLDTMICCLYLSPWDSLAAPILKAHSWHILLAVLRNHYGKPIFWGGIKQNKTMYGNFEGFPLLFVHCLGWCHLMIPRSTASPIPSALPNPIGCSRMPMSFTPMQVWMEVGSGNINNPLKTTVIWKLMVGRWTISCKKWSFSRGAFYFFFWGGTALLSHWPPLCLFYRCYKCTQKARYTRPFWNDFQGVVFADAFLRQQNGWKGPDKNQGKQCWDSNRRGFGRWAIIYFFLVTSYNGNIY